MFVSDRVARAAIYVRFSENELQRSTSVDDQLRECREYAARQGWTVVAEYVEGGVRASNMAARKELARLLADVRRGVVDVVVIWEVSRWSRDGWQGMADFALVMQLGVRVADTRRGLIDPNEPLDFMRVSFDLGAAKQESRTLGDRARRGQAGQVTRGYNSGGRLYGYGAVRDEDEKGRILGTRLEPYEPEAAIVRRIFSAFDEGKGYYAIAKMLNDEGVPSPNRRGWAHTTVRAMLRNPKYKGEASYGKTTRSGPVSAKTGKKRQSKADATRAVINRQFCTPLVDAELWERVQARVQAVAVAHQAAGRRPPEGRKTLLTGFVKCGTCGLSFQACGSGWLRCSGRQRFPCSNRRWVKRDDIESTLRHVINAIAKDPAALAGLVERHNAVVDAANAHRTASLQDLDRQLAEVDRVINELVEAIESGGGKGRVLAARLEQREAERQELQDRRDQAARFVLPSLAPRITAEAVARGDAPLLTGELAQDREVLQRMVREVTIWEDDQMAIEFIEGELIGAGTEAWYLPLPKPDQPDPQTDQVARDGSEALRRAGPSPDPYATWVKGPLGGVWIPAKMRNCDVPTGIRTLVAGVKSRSPGPLDDGDGRVGPRTGSGETTAHVKAEAREVAGVLMPGPRLRWGRWTCRRRRSDAPPCDEIVAYSNVVAARNGSS